MIEVRPRQVIIDGLEKSKELYIKLQSVIQSDENIEATLREKLKDIDILKERIRTMPFEEFKELLRDSL